MIWSEQTASEWVSAILTDADADDQTHAAYETRQEYIFLYRKYRKTKVESTKTEASQGTKMKYTHAKS